MVYGRAAGLGEAEIDRVCIGPTHEAWTDHERLLLEAADELHLEQQIGDETWKKLQEEFDEAQLVELPFVVGNYVMLSMVANATGVPLEEGLPRLPASPAAEGRALTAPKQG